MVEHLPGVADGRALDKRVAQEASRAARYGGTFSLMMIDIDDFKALNDEHGHLAGDRILRGVSKLVAGETRTSDFVTRYGGEEFAVICFRSTLDDLAHIAETVRRETEKIELKYGKQIVRITTSVGAAQVDAATGEITVEALIQRADECLFEAKRAGRNRVIIAR